MTSQTYLDVAATQIQSWLGRSSDLRGRRGASTMLTAATSSQSWRRDMPAGARWNDEAGDVDGVVSLIVEAGDVQVIARMCLSRLRRALPAVTLEAVWHQADTYIGAYASMLTSTSRLLSTPQVAELPLAGPCQQCAISPAEGEPVRILDKRKAICRDCTLRYQHAGTTTDLPPTHALALRGVSGKIPLDMKSLAKVGHAGSGAATRVALIYADGNNVGAFIRAAARSGVPKQQIAPAITESTLAAFRQAATCAVVGDTVGVIPHIVGGDDMVVSVVASHAWPFLLTYLTAFSDELGQQTANWSLAAGVALPTVSAGIIFAHSGEPLSDCIELAEKAMGRAKTLAGPAVDCLDLVQQAPESIDDASREPRTKAWLDNASQTIDALATRPQSLRKTLEAHTRRTDGTAMSALLTTVDNGNIVELKQDHEGKPFDLDAVRWLLQVSGDRP
jgi:hypothetical protein